MKIFRFVALAIAFSLLLATFAPTLGAQKPTLTNTAGLGLPSLSPFLLAASAPIVAAGGEQPENNTIGYSCKLTAQTPADWKVMGRRTTFNVKWTLKNTGTKVWGIHGVDVKFRGGFPTGTKIHDGPNLFDLPHVVRQGETISLFMDMTAPKNNGNYVDNWGLYLGNLVFCKFYIAISVYNK